jgi:hypothetical protein
MQKLISFVLIAAGVAPVVGCDPALDQPAARSAALFEPEEGTGDESLDDPGRENVTDLADLEGALTALEAPGCALPVAVRQADESVLAEGVFFDAANGAELCGPFFDEALCEKKARDGITDVERRIANARADLARAERAWARAKGQGVSGQADAERYEGLVKELGALIKTLEAELKGAREELEVCAAKGNPPQKLRCQRATTMVEVAQERVKYEAQRLENARTTLKRLQGLAAAVSQAEIDAAATRVTQAQNDLKAASEFLANARRYFAKACLLPLLPPNLLP